MPQSARTASGTLVHARRASKQDGREYYCPYCETDVYLAGGEHTQFEKHFKHYRDETCMEYGDYDETQLHIHGKDRVMEVLQATDWATDLKVESRLDSSKPDIRFTAGDVTIGVEVQVSGISADRLRQRTASHSKSGAYTLWLFHTETYGTRTESKSGNEYIQFKAGELGYMDLLPETDDGVWVNYHDPESDGLGIAQYVKLFEDKGGGWPEYSRTITAPATFITPGGLKLAGAEQAIPEQQGDEHQGRLF